MIYEVTHVTRYHYRATVPVTRNMLHLTPVDRPGQRVLATSLVVDPRPAERSEGVDFFGNRTTRITLRTPHAFLEIHAASTVSVVARDLPRPGSTPTWETIADLAATGFSLAPEDPVHYIFPSRSVPLVDEATTYAARSFPPGRRILDGAVELNRRIRSDFAYDPTATDVTTPVAKVFAGRRGVCQDFAHAMISGLRGLGLPARYVSGYLRTEPPPGRPRLAGADATHAWVEIWCGPAEGWIGLDPTNAIAAGDSHVVLAVGRDYADVSPVDGVIVYSGPQGLSVGVDVVEVDPARTNPRVLAPKRAE
ncbi:transglutaminase family protein [Prosthecomicrobium hirschii]|uniref:transglutaminase family protein n=1 Tax=Prosthecodimorpha hirschii TaxID=665126 RepID=UPI002221148F|nr:transglutaminase family protein [Prosthecomicrobium hirschii]MCW1841417.1 transglutaminase family protein [Prosthecomicrobium hirschii]